MMPLLFHVPELPATASHMTWGGAPNKSTFFSLLPAKKAMNLPSGDQNGATAPSVPGRTFPLKFSIARTQSIESPAELTMAAACLPSGDIAIGSGAGSDGVGISKLTFAGGASLPENIHAPASAAPAASTTVAAHAMPSRHLVPPLTGTGGSS